MNKKGQELSTSTIILIILGVIILVILAVGFIFGWNKLAPWIKKENNVDSISALCDTACLTRSWYDFCTRERELRIDQTIEGLKDKGNYTCEILSGYAGLKIKPCTDIDCAQ